MQESGSSENLSKTISTRFLLLVCAIPVFIVGLLLIFLNFMFSFTAGHQLLIVGASSATIGMVLSRLSCWKRGMSRTYCDCPRIYKEDYPEYIQAQQMRQQQMRLQQFHQQQSMITNQSISFQHALPPPPGVNPGVHHGGYANWILEEEEDEPHESQTPELPKYEEVDRVSRSVMSASQISRASSMIFTHPSMVAQESQEIETPPPNYDQALAQSRIGSVAGISSRRGTL